MGADPREIPVPAHVQGHPVHARGHYAILTAQNPFIKDSKGTNEGLSQDLQRLGYKHEPTPGHYNGTPEDSFIVHGLPLDHALSLGQKYGQESVLMHRPETGAEIHYINGDNRGHFVAADPQKPMQYFGERPADNWTAMPGDTGFFRHNFIWDKLYPREVAKAEHGRQSFSQMEPKTMGKKTSIPELKRMMAERLRKFEADFQALAKREGLVKAHAEPGVHEALTPGEAPHMEPGGHEGVEMDMPDLAPENPVGSSLGIPSGDLAASPLSQPSTTSQDPAGSCVTCGQEDKPGSCTCLGMMKSETGSVAKKDKEPQSQPTGGNGGPLAMGEASPAAKAELCAKGCGSAHKAEVLCKPAVKKATDFIDVDGKKKTKGVAGKAVLPPKGADGDLGPGMAGPAPKEIKNPGNGSVVKAEKPNTGMRKIPCDDCKTPMVTIGEHRPSESHVCNKCVAKEKAKKAEPPMAKPPSGKAPNAAAPMAAPKAPKVGGVPSAPVAKAVDKLVVHGSDDKSKPKAPKGADYEVSAEAGKTVYQAKPLDKAALAATKPAGAASPGLPGPAAQAGRAQTHQAALGGAFTPKGPITSGLELQAPPRPAQARPKGGAPVGSAPVAMTAASAVPKPAKAGGLLGHLLGKSEIDLGDCPLCGCSEHPGRCQAK